MGKTQMYAIVKEIFRCIAIVYVTELVEMIENNPALFSRKLFIVMKTI